MSDIVIRAESLGKKYVIGHQAESGRYLALRDVLMHNMRSMWNKTKDLFHGNAIIQGDSTEEVWALRDIGFEISQGEVVGIVGRNGAGKSTLLKILSRITDPTEGRVELKGRTASLLEVGTGFHPELTGRENIYLNGAILGMSRAEIRKNFDAIVEFAEVEKFLDTPVKRYSSGMYVRLAFAVAAHLEPEILIVDEVLAVGDVQFQKKCLGKMEHVARGGKTVLLVTHNMAAVQALCTSAIYLDEGLIRAVGTVDSVVNRYLEDSADGQSLDLSKPVVVGEGLNLVQFKFDPNPAASGSRLRFTVEFSAETATRVSDLALLLYSAQGWRVAILDFRVYGLPFPIRPGHNWRIEGEIDALPLVEGDYQAGLYVNTDKFHRDLFDLATIAIRARECEGYAPYPANQRGVLELDFSACLGSQPQETDQLSVHAYQASMR
jgi:lipopolysaccharide transport system ATP-binding protein